MELSDYLDMGHRLNPEAPCLVQGDRRWTYRDAVESTHRVAGALARDGFKPGDRITVLSPNRADAFLALLGGMRARLLWLPVNPRYSVESITQLLKQFSCDVLILDPTFAPHLETFRAGVPSLRKFISLDAAFDGAESLETWLAPAGTRHELEPVEGHEIAAVLPTGGTTGASKGVLQNYRAWETYVAIHMITMWHAGPPRFLAATPMTHAAGGLCLPMLARGGTIFVMDGARPVDVALAINKHGITDLFLPPTVIYNMLAEPAVRALRFPSLKYLLYGAAPMSKSKLREALEWLGPVLVQGYGQTEAILLCTLMRPEDHYVGGDVTGPFADDERLSSCGRPVPLVKVAIMDEDGHLLGDNERGEIVVRAGHVMQGYENDPAASAAASRFGWHHTGDIGYRDSQGYYHVVDRLRDMIICGGLNIYPSEIEQVLWAHPAVNDCAVVGSPDPKWGEIVTAVVEAKPGATIDAEEIAAYCRDKLGSIKTPKSVLVWPTLPRSPVGKVLKRAIRDRLWEGHDRRV